MPPRIGFRRGLVFLPLTFWGREKFEGSGRFIMSAMAKADQIPVDDQSPLLRQIVEIGRICGPE
jgi:hypothetical protein